MLDQAGAWLSSAPGRLAQGLSDLASAGVELIDAALPGTKNISEGLAGVTTEGAKLSGVGQVTAVAAGLATVVLTRPNPGRDGGISRHILEQVEGKTNSVIHQVERAGEIVHQHTTHVGQYGGLRRFPDAWTGILTIP